jgi:hypothetical protein
MDAEQQLVRLGRGGEQADHHDEREDISTSH